MKKNFKETLSMSYAPNSNEYIVISELFPDLQKKSFKDEMDLQGKIKVRLRRKLRLVSYFEDIGYYELVLEKPYEQWRHILYVISEYKKICGKLIKVYGGQIKGLAEMPDERILKRCIKFQEKLEKDAEEELDPADFDLEKERKTAELEEFFEKIEEEEEREEEAQRRRETWLY